MGAYRGASLHICLLLQDFFGGYDHGKRGGVVHVANHHISPVSWAKKGCWLTAEKQGLVGQLMWPTTISRQRDGSKRVAGWLMNKKGLVGRCMWPTTTSHWRAGQLFSYSLICSYLERYAGWHLKEGGCVFQPQY